MENVNKIQLRLDQISTTAITITVPFGLEFFPVDNTELQETEFIEKEKEKAINPIFDNEKYPFYPTFISTTGQGIIDAFNVEYLTNLTVEDLGLTYEDVFFNRFPFRKTYLRLNFYDSRDTKTQTLFTRETIHLKIDDDWFVDGDLKPLNQIFVKFYSNAQNLIFSSKSGEGFNFYWHKNNLPYSLFMRPSIMNAKTGKVMNLYSNAFGTVTPPPSVSVAVTSNGYNYIKCDFFEDVIKRQKYYYIFNSDAISNIQTTEDSLNPIVNKITINLFSY